MRGATTALPGTIDYKFEDWKMAKDRIKHFDATVVSIRLQGIGIAATIMSIGVASLRFTGVVRFPIGPISLTGAAAIVLIGSLYVIPVLILDVFHYELLKRSVKRASDIEKDPAYQGKLQITTALTSKRLTQVHNISIAIVYGLLLAFGLVLAAVLNSLPPTALGP